MKQKTIIVIIVVLAVLAEGYLLIAGLQKPAPLSKPELTAPFSETDISQEDSKIILEEVGEVREIAIEGTEFRFSENSISLKQGKRIKLVFTNKGLAFHDFVIEDLGIKTKVIGPGQTDIIEFTAPSSGTYNFYCSVPGHKEAGMTGSLSVE